MMLPFDGEHLFEIIHKVISKNPAPINQRYSQELRDLISELLCKDPERRPTIGEVIQKRIIKDAITEFKEGLKTSKYKN